LPWFTSNEEPEISASHDVSSYSILIATDILDIFDEKNVLDNVQYFKTIF
jgi:hypothetical protein